MTTELTVIRAPDGTRLCKVIDANGTQDVDNLPYLLEFATASADSLAELFELLEHLRHDPQLCVIRGKLKPDVEQPCRRLVHDDKTSGDRATLDEVPCGFVLFDFDSVACPESIHFTSEPERAALYLRAQLPTAFHGAGCVWRATSSAGVKPGIRLHLWFLLSTPLGQAQLVEWTKALPQGIKIDRSVFRPTQPHFTADPQFRGVSDPMSCRIGQLSGLMRAPVPVEVIAFVAPVTTERVKGDREITPNRPTDQAKFSDPLLSAAVARWSADHPSELTDDPHVRFECPACGSSDGCCVLPDGSGKLFCHGAKHFEVCPHVGSPVAGGYVGTRVEFELGVSSKDLRAKLDELGYTASYPAIMGALGSGDAAASAAAAAMGDVVEGVVRDADDSPAAKELIKAAKELASACAAIKRTGSGMFGQLATNCFKWVPRCLSAGDVSRALLAANLAAPVGAGLTQPEAEAILATAAARGVARPHKRAPVSLTLAVDEFGNPLSTQANVITLCHTFTDLIALDVRQQRMVLKVAPPWVSKDPTWVQRPIDDGDAGLVCKYLSDKCEYPSATSTQVEEGFKAICSAVPSYDPVRDYLDALPREMSRDDAWLLASSWLSEFAGVVDSPYVRAVSARWLISAVARTYRPGCMAREVLTLIGAQNMGKSSLFRALCPEPRFFKDDLSLKNEQTAKQGLLGIWIVELAEVDKWLHQDRHGDLKAFISTCEDKVRLPYGRHESALLRRQVLCATTNDENPLSDPTGNTRYNVVRVSGALDFEGLAASRDELWSAAGVLFEAGEPWWLQGDEKLWAVDAQEKHRAIDDVEAWLSELLESPHPMPTNFGAQSGATHQMPPFDASPDQLGEGRHYAWVTVPQIREAARVRGVRVDNRRLGRALRNLQWFEDRTMMTGVRVRRFIRP